MKPKTNGPKWKKYDALPNFIKKYIEENKLQKKEKYQYNSGNMAFDGRGWFFINEKMIYTLGGKIVS